MLKVQNREGFAHDDLMYEMVQLDGVWYRLDEDEWNGEEYSSFPYKKADCSYEVAEPSVYAIRPVYDDNEDDPQIVGYDVSHNHDDYKTFAQILHVEGVRSDDEKKIKADYHLADNEVNMVVFALDKIERGN